MNLRQVAQHALKVMDDHMYRADTHEFYEAKEALRAALAEPEQEPCAMRYDFDGYGYKYIDSGSGSNWQERIKGAEPLYTAPTPRKPLTDEEIWKCLPPEEDELAFARAIERAHGIGEQT